ncbi:MAG: 50S ribosomal protein L22 [Spirochaetales bacterium]|jgi:ribosomal protein L22|nr:uL22 family ribosomal protein [Exilispira sp.]NMC67555.1 50S ribosomal protein L22 [Spirochaetales bacterium]
MKSRAIEKFIRVSQTKVLRYSREVPPGMLVNDAINKLTFVNTKGAKVLKKALESAKANMISMATTHNIDIDDSNFTVEKISVLKAPTYRRLRRRGRGHADVISKRNSHIFVEISDERVKKDQARGN